MTHLTFSTFIPVSGDPEHKKFVLDIDSIELDGNELLNFPTGTHWKVAEEFMTFLLDEVGQFSFEVHEMERGIIYASFNPPLDPEIRDEIEDLIIDLSNSVRSSNRNA